MGRNIIGYFKGLENDHLYSVKITSNAASTSYSEVKLAGDSPFVVSYENSDNLFSPVRISTATIQVVNDEYMIDIFSSNATGTSVVLKDETDKAIKWKGYLKPNLYDQGYDSCWETIQLEASDCLAALQYFTFTKTQKSINTFHYILTGLFDKCGITKYYHMLGKKIDETQLSLTLLEISEQNFFSSDTDEGWKMNEILEEMLKYVGYTAIQWGEAVYLLDYNVISKSTSAPEFREWYKSGARWVASLQKYTFGGDINVEKDDYRAAGSSISLDTIYNKAVVNCSTYNVENLTPDIWSDDNCHNRNGEWHNCSYINAYTQQRYLNSKEKITYEESKDSENVYVHRILDNKYYQSHYYKTDGSELEVTFDIQSQMVTVNEGNYYTTGSYSFTNNGITSHTVHSVAEVEIVYVEEGHTERETETDDATFTINPGETKIISFNAEITDARANAVYYNYYYTVDGNTFINYVGSKDSGVDKAYMGGTLKDITSYTKISNKEYNYEPSSSVDFTRYILLNQYHKPLNRGFYASTGATSYNNYPTGYDIDLTQHPALYSLVSGYTNPIIYGDNTYICINTQAICERYSVNYINPEWTSVATGLNSGIFSHMSTSAGCGASALSLIFKLAIGNKYWDGSQWTTTDTCFTVPMSTQLDKDNKADLTNIWNTTFHVLNNFSWDEWSGGEGYKIPLQTGLTGEIKFEIHLPTKLQYYYSSDSSMDWYKNTLNGTTWLSNLTVKVASQNQQINTDEDIVYENVINDESINEFDEISLRINTNPGKVPLSYSFVGKSTGGFLETITDYGGTAQKPEENIIERIVNQYSTPTKKETLNLSLKYTPFHKVIDTYWDDELKMAVLGQEIDYAAGRQQISLIELK